MTALKRPSWDDYFMGLAFHNARMSTCIRRHVGAVLVRGKRIIATGFNGRAPGLPHCSEIGCLREARKIPSGEALEICRGVHAEKNIINFAARYGISTEGTTLYCTHFPCYSCAKDLISAGIVKVIYCFDYAGEVAELAKKEFREAGVAVIPFLEQGGKNRLYSLERGFRSFLAAEIKKEGGGNESAR